MKLENECDCSICENHEYDGENRMNIKQTIEYTRGDSQFFDRRKSYLTFYSFCPFCGQKINWKEIKKLIIKK